MSFEKQISAAAILTAAFLLSACTGLQSTTQPSAPPPPARPVPTPASLTGVGPATVRAALGNPAFKRTETGAEIWQYGAGQCRLFVYFYDAAGEPEAAGPRSAHVDARRADGGPSDVGACLSEIVQAAPLSP